MKKKALLVMGMVMSMTAFAQEEIETTVKGDVVSYNIWRGLDCGSVSVQPTLGVSYKDLSLSAWGTVGLADANDTKQLDLTLGYTAGKLNIGVSDYWFSVGLDPQNRYFKYDSHGTNHLFEANIGYNFGAASLQWYTNFAGNDGVNKEGKRAYSSYAEVVVPFKLSDIEWTATAGAVPFASSYYGTKGFAVTNLSLRAEKDIKVTDTFSIPVFARIVGNPCSQKAYLIFGFTLKK